MSVAWSIGEFERALLRLTNNPLVTNLFDLKNNGVQPPSYVTAPIQLIFNHIDSLNLGFDHVFSCWDDMHETLVEMEMDVRMQARGGSGFEDFLASVRGDGLMVYGCLTPKQLDAVVRTADKNPSFMGSTIHKAGKTLEAAFYNQWRGLVKQQASKKPAFIPSTVLIHPVDPPKKPKPSVDEILNRIKRGYAGRRS